MARRRNAITHRFARMRGLPPEEKALMQRIGNLMDAALNNRQASNPFEQSQVRTNRQIYPPTGLLTQAGLSAVKILWNATPSNELLRYEVEFINLTTGLSETKTTFTNEITYKGADGSYLARVKSVGRDGSSSTIRQVTFGLGDDPMLIEGAKNGATELGTLVQDNIKLRDGYSTYAWGSCVLDKYMLDTNNEIVFRLWRADIPDAFFSQAYLVETIRLYPGTESGTNLDSTARAGLITRPAGVRAGSFETPQSIMFSPQQATADEDDTTVTYFLQAVNREVEQDEVCLSLVLWSGADGIGTAVPGDPYTPPVQYIFPQYNSFHKTGSPTGNWQGDFPYDKRSWSANIEDGWSLIGNKWTVAMWVRFDNLDANNIANEQPGPTGPPDGTVDGGTQYLFGRHTIASNGEYRPNSWLFSISASDLGGSTFDHDVSFSIFDYRAGYGGNPDDGVDNRVIRYSARAFGNNNEKSAIFKWGDATSNPAPSENNAWYFMVMCFEGGDYTDNNIPKFRLYMNTAEDDLTGEPKMALMIPTDAPPDGSKKPVTQTDDGAMAYLFETIGDSVNHHYLGGIYNGDLLQGPYVTAGTQYHQIGIWNTALDSGVSGPASNIGPIESLFNQGRGWAVDWRRNTATYEEDGPFGDLNYIQAENLVHLCQMGAVEEPFSTKQAGRDRGYYLPDWEGELNWTFDRWEQGYEFHRIIQDENYHKREIEGNWYDNLPSSWCRGTDIYDVLSPLGTNGTTQYDFSYPGQNMSGSGTNVQSEGDYPDYDDWVEAGSDLSILPWLTGPYPPGYHKDDPDRPVEVNP